MSRFVVIGGANVDLIGSADQPLRLHDSNPGTIRTMLGGVGRNIAENLARLQEPVSLVSAVGDDSFGHWILEQGRQCGIDMRAVQLLKGQRTSAFLAILDPRHDLHCAVADMGILNELNPAILQPVLDSLDPEDVLIWDTNLDPELIKWIGGQAHCLLAMDPLSASKSEKARCILPKLTYFKPNRAEAERLCGFTIETPAQIRSALDWFAAQGIKETVLSLGAQGTALAVGQQRLLMSLDSIVPVNTTGAGDCFFAVYLSCRRQGVPLQTAAERAAGAAALTLSDPLSVSPRLKPAILDHWRARLHCQWQDLTQI